MRGVVGKVCDEEREEREGNTNISTRLNSPERLLHISACGVRYRRAVEHEARRGNGGIGRRVGSEAGLLGAGGVDVEGCVG